MNLPNKITCVRIALIPVFIFFYLATFIYLNYLIATIVFIVAAFTDFLDGYIARKNNLVTNLGKFLDPIADKLLVLSALLVLIATPVVPLDQATFAIAPIIANPWGVIIVSIIIGRELVVSAFRQVAASKGFIMAADKWGKIKMVVQTIAIPVLLFQAQAIASGWISGDWATILPIISYSLIVIATLLTIFSGINYLVKNRAIFKDSK